MTETAHIPCPIHRVAPTIVEQKTPGRRYFMAMCPYWGCWRGPYAPTKVEALDLWEQALYSDHYNEYVEPPKTTP